MSGVLEPAKFGQAESLGSEVGELAGAGEVFGRADAAGFRVGGGRIERLAEALSAFALLGRGEGGGGLREGH